jgi:crossover junction endodeoxyribonuclease RuvC
MFDELVLGVDPGVAHVGLAAVARDRGASSLVWSDAISTQSSLDQAVRLLQISRAVAAAIETYRPTMLALERVAWNVNKVSAMAVSRATGVVMAAAAAAGVGVEEYGSLEVKNAVCGFGNADKAQVRLALARLHGLRDVPADPDAVDAVAVAVAHLVRARFAAAAGRSSKPARAGRARK